jgi:hypothetical protein
MVDEHIIKYPFSPWILMAILGHCWTMCHFEEFSLKNVVYCYLSILDCSQGSGVHSLTLEADDKSCRWWLCFGLFHAIPTPLIHLWDDTSSCTCFVTTLVLVQPFRSKNVTRYLMMIFCWLTAANHPSLGQTQILAQGPALKTKKNCYECILTTVNGY